MDEEEEGPGASAYERFKRLWRNERCAPALLPFDEDLVGTIVQQINAQVRRHLNPAPRRPRERAQQQRWRRSRRPRAAGRCRHMLPARNRRALRCVLRALLCAAPQRHLLTANDAIVVGAARSGRTLTSTGKATTTRCPR